MYSLFFWCARKKASPTRQGPLLNLGENCYSIMSYYAMLYYMLLYYIILHSHFIYYTIL